MSAPEIHTKVHRLLKSLVLTCYHVFTNPHIQYFPSVFVLELSDHSNLSKPIIDNIRTFSHDVYFGKEHVYQSGFVFQCGSFEESLFKEH